MVTSRRVNGIYLTKSGKARYNSEEKRKLNLMVTANQVMRRVTKICPNQRNYGDVI